MLKKKKSRRIWRKRPLRKGEVIFKQSLSILILLLKSTTALIYGTKKILLI